MRSTYTNTDLTKSINKCYVTTGNKTGVIHNFHVSQKPHETSQYSYEPSYGDQRMGIQHSSESLFKPKSIYENYNADFYSTSPLVADRNRSLRRSRLHNHTVDESVNNRTRRVVKRDLSMPPISGRPGMTAVENALYAQNVFVPNKLKLSIDGGLDSGGDGLEDPSGNVYDTVNVSLSVTPPPVNLVSSGCPIEYVNRKAIIRPLAFKPVQSQFDSEPSPTKLSFSSKTSFSQHRKLSPPPVPPHANRVTTKTNLTRVQSAKSGDSSGYCSSRIAGTVTGNASSTDISPTFDDGLSIMDSILTSEIYANALDNRIAEPNQDIVSRSSLETEIASERQRSKMLESALASSNCKLLDAESQIIELKKLLSHKSNELNKTIESLAIVKCNLDHQNQKSQQLEKTIQSLQTLTMDRVKDRDCKNQCTQTVNNADMITTKLFEQFDEERKTWFDEKYKVLTYQKQIESNFQQLLIQCRSLESQILQLKGQLKEARNRQPILDEHDKLSPSSAGSSHRGIFSNISRIEVTEHQASF